MRKIMILAGMMAMMLALASPAFAHAIGGDVDVLAVDASQVATVDVTQSQFGDATATSGDIGSAADASIDNSLDVSVTQVNAGVGGVAAGGDLDLDGVADIFDVDDDNDGILDEFEFVVFF